MPSSKTLILSSEPPQNVKLCVRNIQLRLQYVELEPALRSKWYKSIANNNLTRVFSTYKTDHRTIKAGTTREYLPAVMSFGLLPDFVSVIFQKESIHCGNFGNAYSYTNTNVKSLTLFKNGIAHFLNQESQGMKIEEDSSTLFVV